MLSAHSPFLWLPLTKPELGKIPPDLCRGGHSVMLGAVNSPCTAAHSPFISFGSAFPIQSSPGVSVGQLHGMGVTQPELPGCACTYTPLYLFIAPVFPSESHPLLALLSQTSTKSDKHKVALPPEGYIIYEAYRLWEITQGRSNMSYIPSYTKAVNYLQAAPSFLCPQGSGDVRNIAPTSSPGAAGDGHRSDLNPTRCISHPNLPASGPSHRSCAAFSRCKGLFRTSFSISLP